MLLGPAQPKSVNAPTIAQTTRVHGIVILVIKLTDRRPENDGMMPTGRERSAAKAEVKSAPAARVQRLAGPTDCNHKPYIEDDRRCQRRDKQTQ